MPYNMDTALKVVEQIGKNRNQKFRIDDENRFAYSNMIRWVHGDAEMKCINPFTKEIVPGNLNAGIYISGKTGVGKSWILEIMSAYSMIDNIQVKMGEMQRPLHWTNIRADEICDEYTAEGSFRRFKKMNILGIQDLGSEPVESMYMGNRVNVMRQILECRGDRTDLITLVTSNLPFTHKRFTDLYGDRVASRMKEMCNYFEIVGLDRRNI